MRRERRAALLREEIEGLHRTKQAPFPRDLRKRLTEYARVRREDGAGFERIEQELGVDRKTLAIWVTKPLARPGKFRRSAATRVTPGLVEVRVSSPAAASGVTEISLPHGITIRIAVGTDTAWASSLVKALAP